MVRDQAPDQRAARGGSRRGRARGTAPRRRGELEDHEPRARPEHAAASRSPASRSARLRTPKPTIAPSKEPSANGSASASAATGGRPAPPCRAPAAASARRNPPRRRAREAGRDGQRGGEVERSGAQIEVPAVGPALPAERVNGRRAPAPVDVEAEQVVEQIVARRDGGEHPPHVAALRRLRR